MSNQSMQAQQKASYLSDGNAEYIETLYEQYLKNSTSVSLEWQHYFEQMPPTIGTFPDVSHAKVKAQFLQLAKEGITRVVVPANSVAAVKTAKVVEFIEAYRAYGHYLAHLDPLGLEKSPKRPELELSYHGLSEADFPEVFSIPDFYSGQSFSLENIYKHLQEIYSGSIGIEYMYLSNFAERIWIQNQFESGRAYLKFSNEQKRRILQKLTAAEGLEKFLGTKYVGQKRFSLEGADVMIPMLDGLIQRAGEHHSVKEVVIGMAHRGRLNVLINTLGKPPGQLFDSFEGKVSSGRSDDVKYHLGASNNICSGSSFVHVVLAFNPSHLEIVNPVVEGSVRARQDRREDAQGVEVLPVLIHGDAAFSGQGVVMETLSLSQISGYYTGGTVHIVINNQVGFTTAPRNSRSSFYCTDAAKMIEAPVFHVNGDDPEAVMFTIQTALDFRMTFKKDVVVDLVCFRRHGHNEADEPAATQPILYQKIKQHEGIRKLYADQLIESGIINAAEADQLVTEYRDALERREAILANSLYKGVASEFLVDWKPYLNQLWRQEVSTGISLESLKKLGEALQIPKTLTLQPQVAKVMEERQKMFEGEIPLNWGGAETLAYARLLAEGYPIRISGQDSQRGTFAHRHAVLHDYKTGEIYTPLANIAKAPVKFSILDSLLSEEAVLGYEYGFSTASPNTLVIWEAQYGDFANGAQVVIDQFISSGEQKWGRLCGLVMFLPHGYEGSGPEHSSARLERFLQLCAQHNIQVCIPTTPAQIFHLISRQILRPYRKPLVVMTPKSLLRHKSVISSLNELATGEFQPILPETEAIEPKTTRRVILCSGKVYYDLLEKRNAMKQKEVALVRIEQLYPFAEEELRRLLEGYKHTQDIVWCQEEPKNQGAWYAMQHRMLACLAKGQKLTYVGREASASPAVGYMFMHVKEQNALLERAFA